jgi:ribosomal protein S21
MMVIVHNGNIEEAIARLKKKVQGSGLMREFKRSSFYETRTQRRKRKDQMARKRVKKMKRRG